MDAFYPTGPNGLWVFILVTLSLGGAASWATGRALAMGWESIFKLFLYMGLMTFAVRFIHYALFHQPFLDPRNVIIDYIILVAIAAFGFRQHRAFQMVTQYPWLFGSAGPLNWHTKKSLLGP